MTRDSRGMRLEKFHAVWGTPDGVNEGTAADRVAVVCNRRDPGHSRKGPTRVETFTRLSSPDLHGYEWRTVDPERGAGPVRRTRRSGERVVLADGESLEGTRRGRTRSAGAARVGYNVDHGRGILETSGEADAYAEALAAGGRVVVELRCRVCGLNVRARLERLGPVLDRVAAADLEEVPLETLRRALES